jgi:hypothetical protein
MWTNTRESRETFHQCIFKNKKMCCPTARLYCFDKCFFCVGILFLLLTKMRICHVAKCGRKISDGVKLYSLPENSVRRQLWLDKIKIKRRKANRHTKINKIWICSKHFYGGIILSSYCYLLLIHTLLCYIRETCKRYLPKASRFCAIIVVRGWATRIYRLISPFWNSGSFFADW